MKKFIYAVSFLAIILSFTASASAQSLTRIDAKVPFAFAVGDEVLEAGNYVMRIRRAAGGAEILEIRNDNNKVVFETVMMQNGDMSSRKPELVFDRVAGQAVLAKIRLNSAGFSVPVEKDAATTIAAKSRKRSSGGSN